MAFDFVKPGGIMPEEIKGKIEESEQEEDQEEDRIGKDNTGNSPKYAAWILTP